MAFPVKRPAPGGPPKPPGPPAPPDPSMDPMQDPSMGGAPPPPDPMMQAGMGSPLAQAGMPMIGGPGGPQPGGLGMPGMPGAMDGGMPMHPMDAMMGGPGGLPPGGSMPPGGDTADSPLLSALMSSMSGIQGIQGGDTSLAGLGTGDPQDGMGALLNMLGLSKMGVQPTRPGASGVPATNPCTLI
jgi:hypothetical protein